MTIGRCMLLDGHSRICLALLWCRTLWERMMWSTLGSWRLVLPLRLANKKTGCLDIDERKKVVGKV